MTVYTSDKLKGLREALRPIVKANDPLDIIAILSGVFADEAPHYARRTGDYSGATKMFRLADALDKIEENEA